MLGRLDRVAAVGFGALEVAGVHAPVADEEVARNHSASSSLSLMRFARILAVVAALALSTKALFAHDFWIEASKFHPGIHERVAFDLKVGQHFEGDSVPRNEKKIVRFVVRGPDGKSEDVLGVDGRTPAGYWRPEALGLYVVGYRSNTTPIELEAVKFESYLAEEGLQPVIQARKASGDSDKKGREIYSRSVKSLILCGELPKADPKADRAEALKGFDARLGLRLEVIPESNPYTLRVGGELPVHVLFDDKPLAGALVGFTAKSAVGEEVRLRTDAEGRVKFKIAHTGEHLVRVVWMVKAPKDADADWESTWSSLTFEIPDDAPPAPVK